MNRRIIKQFIYGIFFIGIMSSLFFGAYFLFFSSPTSCFDNRLNQGEEKTDCGGSCVSCAIKNAHILETKLINIFPVESGVVALIEIKNPNTTVGAEKFIYSISVSKDTSQGLEI